MTIRPEMYRSAGIMRDLCAKGFRSAGVFLELDEGEAGATRVIVTSDGRLFLISGFLVEWPQELLAMFGPPIPT